jgi:hypothetical protein
MNFGTWWEEYGEDPFERVGRIMVGAMGQELSIHMPRMSWAYVDWLAEVEGCDMVGFFKDNDEIYLPSDGCFHDWMEGAVRTGFLRREHKGLPRPNWLRPALPEEMMEVVDI